MNTAGTEPVVFRHQVEPSDRRHVRRLVASTDMFRPDEIDVAVELVDERLARGDASGYHFVFALLGGEPAGYACFGPIACTLASFDLYWIAVDQVRQGRGLGRMLIEQSERRIRMMGGTRVYIDTSNREQYLPTRRFYERCGYACQALLPDFYSPGDDRVIFAKILDDLDCRREP